MAIINYMKIELKAIKILCFFYSWFLPIANLQKLLNEVWLWALKTFWEQI